MFICPQLSLQLNVPMFSIVELQKFKVIGHAKICSPSKVGRCAEISSPSKFRNPHWKWLVPVLHPTEMPNEDQFLESTLFIQVSLKTCNCLSTSEFPPGTLLFHNCQLPPAGSAPYCHRAGQTIYKFLPFSKQRLLILRQSEYLQLWRGFFLSILTHQGDIREVHLMNFHLMNFHLMNFTISTVCGCFWQ